ncbi:MAG: hypothetical protein ACYS7M_03655, partial [Planctomycetota bacterium]
VRLMKNAPGDDSGRAELLAEKLTHPGSVSSFDLTNFNAHRLRIALTPNGWNAAIGGPRRARQPE